MLADFEMRLDAAARAKASRARSARAKAGHDKPAPGADAASAKGRRNGKPVTRP